MILGPIIVGCFFKNIMNQITKIIPLKILEALMLHQTPDKPNKAGEDRISAAGIRAPVKKILTIDGGTVLPNPLKAPEVVISKHIKSCDTPNILK